MPFTLGLVELQGEHSGLNQAAVVWKVLQDFGISNTLGYFVMDNVGSHDRLVQVIADNLHEEGIAYDAKQRRLRCNGHIISLAVQAFLFGKTVSDYDYPDNAITDSPTDVQLDQWRKLGPLGKLHNIISCIMGSTQRVQAFKIRSNNLMPYRDDGTRWNSWYDMLDWAIQRIKAAIIAVINEEAALAKDLLTAEEWKTLSHIRDFLKGFHDATQATEGRQATLDKILPTMDFLADRFEDAVEQYSDHNYMRESLQSGYTKLLEQDREITSICCRSCFRSNSQIGVLRYMGS